MLNSERTASEARPVADGDATLHRRGRSEAARGAVNVVLNSERTASEAIPVADGDVMLQTTWAERSRATTGMEPRRYADQGSRAGGAEGGPPAAQTGKEDGGSPQRQDPRGRPRRAWNPDTTNDMESNLPVKNYEDRPSCQIREDQLRRSSKSTYMVGSTSSVIMVENVSPPTMARAIGK